MQGQSFFDSIVGITPPTQAHGMITAEQCRAARGLLDWSQRELALKAKVGIVTVRQVEGGLHEPRRSTLEVIRRAFENAGVEFIDENGGGTGVRLRRASGRRAK